MILITFNVQIPPFNPLKHYLRKKQYSSSIEVVAAAQLSQNLLKSLKNELNGVGSVHWKLEGS